MSIICSPSRLTQTPNRASMDNFKIHERDLSKSLEQVEHQVKFLHLQAEIESLLQQLQIQKQQRLATN